MLPADARRLAEQLVPALCARGATAVALTGSYARGDATDRSDLDLLIVGDGPDYLLHIREELLVAESWAPEDAHRRRFRSPADVGSSIPGWREAIILQDADGAAARLRAEALDWAWEDLGGRANEWVAEEVAGLAEEVHKLVAALDHGRTLTAAAQRHILALRLAPILAVHHRLLYGSENGLWEQVGQLMGPEWQEAQGAAFGTGGESFETSCAAALRLFEAAVHSVASLLDQRQAAVVAHALAAYGAA